MHSETLVFTMFLIFTGAALAATLALYARQALPVAYILLGGLLGPWGLALVEDAGQIAGISDIGIIFLLFLLGLNLPAQKLFKLVGETTLVTLGSSLVFGGFGMLIGLAFGYSPAEQLVIAVALMFSSTIIGLKLLPTTTLHHQRTGELMISVLLLQDLIAIAALLLMQIQASTGAGVGELLLLAISLPGLFVVAWLLERFVLITLIRRFDTIQEYIFLMALGWCLGMAELAALAGLSHEVGAFIAGVALATNPIARYIAEALRPLRDFFLIIFFFALGAGFDWSLLGAVWLPALLLAGGVLVIKPLVFAWLFRRSGEAPGRALEIGVRLGQISEFSLLVAVLALQLGLVGQQASALLQAATVLTFVLSSYWIVMRYPTPVAVSARLRRD